MDGLDLSKMSLNPGKDQMLELGQIIQDSLATLVSTCDREGVSLPSLDDPFTPASEAFRSIDEAKTAANALSAATFQLLAAVMPPPLMVMTLISGHMQAASLRVCAEANVPEILRDAGPAGMHVDQIAEQAKLPAGKLARILRHLATRHVFKEITPDVFANTRLSSVLDTGKPVEALVADPGTKHDDGSSGFASLVMHQWDEVAKSVSYLWENLSDPATADSYEVKETAFNRGLSTDLTYWEYFDTPEQAYRLKRFGCGMRGVVALQPPNQILGAYQWETLPEGSVIVDVGGGVGTSSLILAEKFDHLHVVVQDRPQVVEEGIKVWNAKLPDVLASGRAKLQAHDFFDEQPVAGAAVYLLGQVLHDWSDPYCVRILERLRAAAGAHTRLVLMEPIVPFACRIPRDDAAAAIPGAVPREAPAPLLANYGPASGLGYHTDITMLTLFNSQERTVKHMRDLLEKAGWRLVEIRRAETAGWILPSIAVPI